MAKAPIVVIGGGIGGLTTAIRLAHAGEKVILFEKNPRVGGKMYEHEQDGFRWDTGPSVITMRHVFEELFSHAGRKLEDYLTFLPIEPLTRYFFADGTQLEASRDWPTMANEIAQFSEQDVEGYLRYLAYAARIHRITGPVFIYDKPPTLSSFAQVPIKDWLKADPFRTMHGAIKRFVKSPHLRQLLGRFATYVGGSPYAAPATLNVIAHVELTGGVWYPKGGIYTIASALEKFAQELGVEIHTSCAIQQINLRDNKVTGITLAGGSIVNTSAVVSNVDVATTYKHLLPPDNISKMQIQRYTEYPPSCSGFILLLGVEGTQDILAHHNLFFTDEYPAEFDAIFKQKRPPQNPSIYLNISSKTDPNHAPDGCENWYILVNAPADDGSYDWRQHESAYRDHILDTLANRHNIDIRDRIRTEKRLTPQDLQAVSGAWQGALYGPNPNNRFAAFRRPHNRSKDFSGLYFVGGTTHPGGGVPMVMLSGKVTANLVLEDRG